MSGAPAMPPDAKPLWKRLTRFAGFILALVLLAFVARVAFRDWQALKSYEWHVNPVLLVAAYLGLLASFCLWPVGVRRVLAVFGKKASLTLCWRAWALSQFAKYLPGGVWAFVARAMLYRRYGLGGATGAFAIIIEVVALVAASQAVFIATLPWFPGVGSTPAVWLPFIALPLLCVALHPKVVSWLYNHLHRRAGSEAPKIDIRYLDMLRLVGFYAVLFVGFTLSFCVLTTALTGLPVSKWPLIVGMFPGAYGLAYLVVVAPSGMGVREGVLTAFLSLVFPVPVAAAVALAARVWWLAVDLSFSGLSLLVLRLATGSALGERADEPLPADSSGP